MKSNNILVKEVSLSFMMIPPNTKLYFLKCAPVLGIYHQLKWMSIKIYWNSINIFCKAIKPKNIKFF